MARALIRVPSEAKKGEVIEVKTLISHPMETGYRRDAMGPAARQVRLGRAGILRQVLGGPELDRVDEDAYGHESALPPGRVHEAVVARVQSAHCRDQADRMPG